MVANPNGSNLMSFLSIWGAFGTWSASSNIPLIPSLSQWQPQSGNSYFGSAAVSTSTLLQNDGTIIIPFTGLYVLDLSINTADFNYVSGLKIYYKLTSTSSMNNASLCVIWIPGESSAIGVVDQSRKIFLNAGDVLSPTFIFKDTVAPKTLPAVSSNTCMSVNFLGNDAPTTISTLSSSGSISTIVNSSFLTVTKTLTSSSGQMLFYLTNDGTATGAPLLSKYFGSFFVANLQNATSSIVTTPIASPNGTISSDLRSISVNVVIGNTINTLLAGSSPSLVAAPITNTIVWGCIFCQFL
jgi:hypothetical protein